MVGGKKRKKNLPCHIKCDMSKRWELRKPWCLAGLYLSGCTYWSILQIPEARAKLQPGPALQKHRSSAWLPGFSRPNTKYKVSTSHLLGLRVGMSSSAWHWCSYRAGRWMLSTVQNVSHISPYPPWADLFCVWVLLRVLFIRSCVGGVALSPGQDCAQPCTSSRVNSPSAHHTPADAGSLLLRYLRLRMGRH